MKTENIDKLDIDCGSIKNTNYWNLKEEDKKAIQEAIKQDFLSNFDKEELGNYYVARGRLNYKENVTRMFGKLLKLVEKRIYKNSCVRKIYIFLKKNRK